MFCIGARRLAGEINMRDTTKAYVFLSYSHKDSIDKLVEWFDANGYNLVYDSELLAGELWDMKIRRYIKNENCKGVLSLVSRSSLSSSAVLKETEYVSLFHKHNACISLENCSLTETFKTLTTEEEKEVGKDFLEYFPAEKVYIRYDDIFDGQTRQLERTLAEWGLFPEVISSEIRQVERYTSALAGERERLTAQQIGYYEFDMRAINKVAAKYEEGRPLVVLDLGCSNGELTSTRFCDSRFNTIIGVDYNPRDIEAAKKANYGDKFHFFCLDLESDDFLDRLNTEISGIGISKVDIVFMALTLHHLRDPNKLLFRLYDVFNDDGNIVLRGSDDGGKLCYPNGELLGSFLSRYNDLVGAASDRHNGRKLYKQLLDAGYVKINMLYNVVDTCEQTRPEKMLFYKVGFAFREGRLKEIRDRNPHNRQLCEEVNEMLRDLEIIKGMFVTRDFWYCNTSYIALASVK